MPRRNFLPWRYTADDGRTYVRRADAAIVLQHVGGVPAGALIAGGANASTDNPYPPEFPAKWRPRGVRVSDATGFGSYVVVYDQTAPLWTDPAQTVDLIDAGGTAHVCTIDEKVGERKGRRKRKEANP